MSGYSYKYNKAIIHQAEPSIRSDYSGSGYNSSSSSYYSTSTASGASTPRTSHSYSTEPSSYTARDYAAKGLSMPVYSRGDVVVINRQHGYEETGAPSPHHHSWANKKSKK